MASATRWRRKLTQGQTGALRGLTARPVRHLIERVKRAGDPGLAHRGRGKPSHRRLPEKVQATVLKLYEKRYGDFGPTLAAEKLAACHGMSISEETLRRWLREHGIEHLTRRKLPHRVWRLGKPMWGHSSHWTARTMTGSRGVDPGVR